MPEATGWRDDEHLPQETTEVTEECWTSMTSDLNGFAKHEVIRVNLQDDISFELECVSSLSPLDMVNLSHGTHDSTGHSVWTGAFFLIEALAAAAAAAAVHGKNAPISHYFQSKRVLELGSGTGAGGLALLLSPETGARPAHVTFSDHDEQVLDLCGRNCSRNLSCDYNEKYSITHLSWGEDPTTSFYFDTILATDVIYDLGCLEALLMTASQSLQPRGIFLLSHVPRACLPDDYRLKQHDNEIGYHCALERIIIGTAQKYCLQVKEMIRPRDIIIMERGGCSSEDTTSLPLNAKSMTEMEESGAALLVFQKCDKK